jgi:GDP-4-dehydro-6-deoxy-D-mannose reductase
MTSVLVTGATGPLGRAVIAQMNDVGGYEVIAAARHLDKQPYLTIPCDVREHAQLEAVLERAKPELVLHLAATTSANDFDEAYKTNVAPAQHILDFILSRRLATRVVLIGSAAEYGIVLPEENPVAEARVLRPVSLYGVSKAWQTDLIGLYWSRGVDVLCARIFNLWGLGISDRLFAGRLLNQIEEVVEKRKTIIELGSLAAVRDYVSIDVAAEQLLSIATFGRSGEIYHVASGVPVTMRELTMRALAARGLDFSTVREAPNLSNRQGYDVPVIYADMSRTNSLPRLPISKSSALDSRTAQ